MNAKSTEEIASICVDLRHPGTSWWPMVAAGKFLVKYGATLLLFDSELKVGV